MRITTASKASRLGTKRTCRACATRFYDLEKPEPTCPKCKAVYDISADPVLPPLEPQSQEELEAEREEIAKLRREKRGRPLDEDKGDESSSEEQGEEDE
jgi:hypothetical protein